MIEPPAPRAERGCAVATNAKQREERAARERARQYQARLSLHEGARRRRIRDNVVAGVAGGILLVAILAGQTLYYVAGPGAPAPTETPSPTPTPTDDLGGLLPTP